MYHKINTFTCFILCQQLSESAKLEKIHHDKFLTNSIKDDLSVYTFETLLKVSVQQCIKACKTTKACEYMNYERLYTKCDLLRTKDDKGILNVKTVVENKPGCVFGNKSEWRAIPSNKCDHCKKYGACITTGENWNGVCRNSGCGKPNGNIISGNMFTNGNIIIVKDSECNNGEIIVIGRQHVNASVCLENGTWSHPYICLNGSEFEGSFYHIHSQLLNWHEGKSYCESLLGHLVDINTEDEQQFIETLLIGEYRVAAWTGGNDFLSSGDFRWSDGSAMEYTYWFLGEPDHEDANCVRINGQFIQHNYKGWTNDGCLTMSCLICEFDKSGYFQ